MAGPNAQVRSTFRTHHQKAGIQEAVNSTDEIVTANDSLETVTAINSTDITVISSSNEVIEINS